jgi:peptide-methionine (S)-S-oxide reductase
MGRIMPTRFLSSSILAVLILSVASVFIDSGSTHLAVESIPPPAKDSNPSFSKGKQKAVLAGGCFWCAEAVFEQLIGVEKVVSGYAGGKPEMAHYELVSSGKTDHAESIQITYDPSKISYGQLLQVFFSVAHDPTQLNRQGPDYGRQYRSAIFYSDPEQKQIAEAYIQQLQEAKTFSKPIVTEVTELKGFYPAEEYHQDFVKRHPTNPYVVANAIPKVEKTKKSYPTLVKK